MEFMALSIIGGAKRATQKIQVFRNLQLYSHASEGKSKCMVMMFM